MVHSMPRASFTHRAITPVPIDSVWKQLQLAETWANVGPVENVSHPEVDENGLLRSFRWRTTVATRHYNGTARVKASDPGHRMKLALDATEVYGSVEAVIEPSDDGGTRVTINLEVISRGTLSTLFFPVVKDTVARGLPEQVETFAAAFV
jgi:carbon monoxide dehydrogenase subunit G